MKEVVAKMKRETDFMLPRACKRARSSVHHSRNPTWELSHRPRRSVVSSGAVQTASGSSRALEEEEDLDEVAMALLEMSTPSARGHSRQSAPGFTALSPLGFGTAQASHNAWQLTSNTVKSVPKIIITSGSSSDSGHAETKSTSSDHLEGVNSGGQTTSPSSHQGSETITFVQNRESAGSSGIRHAQTVTVAYTDGKPDPHQGLEAHAARSLQLSDRQPCASKGGQTISTGICLSNGAKLSSNQVAHEALPRHDQPGITTANNRLGAMPDLHKQLVLQQVLQNRLASKSQAGRPIANSRGGNLIVLPNPMPKAQPGLTNSATINHLSLEEAGPLRSNSPSGLAHMQTERQPLTLTRVPTLVLSTAQKPSKPRASPAPSKAAAPSVPPSSTPAVTMQEQDVEALPQALQPSGSGKAPPQSAFANKGPAEAHGEKDGDQPGKEAVPGGIGPTSSGEESSEDDWLPNWSLNLYNALNPTVVTTGHTFLGARSTSQSLEAKALPAGK